jgi:hypothetical protein
MLPFCSIPIGDSTTFERVALKKWMNYETLTFPPKKSSMVAPGISGRGYVSILT